MRSNNTISPPFDSFNAVPQGDPLSPLLYSIFTSDLPDIFSHEGVSIGNTELKYLLYADDLALIAATAEGLQHALNRLEFYANKNNLTVNKEKTKCMTFYKGFCPKRTFLFEGQELESCNAFTYLGIVLTTRLSSTKHVTHILSKCKAKIGYLFPTLNLKELPLNVVIDVFNTYVLPIITYGLSVWLPGTSQSSLTKLNALYSKFLKRYLGIPYSANNAIVYFLCNACPLSHILERLHLKAALKVSYPREIQQFQITLPEEKTDKYNPIPDIPSYFWLSLSLNGSLPLNPESRRALLYVAMDLVHHHICKNKEFHLRKRFG